MFTDQELKVLHYQMWDYIANNIQEHKRVMNISKVKLEFLESQNIDADSISYNCPMCQYNNQHASLRDITPCIHCPSVLNVSYFRGCLSGIYHLCIYAEYYDEQLTLALAIRDSWR